MKRQRKDLRRGAIAVLAAFLSIVVIAVVAFSVDIGYVLTAKEEMQRTADASRWRPAGSTANNCRKARRSRTPR